MSTPQPTAPPSPPPAASPKPTAPGGGWTLFTPKYVKHGKLLLEGVQKFIHYKRDILKPEVLREIEAQRDNLKAALAARDADRIRELEENLGQLCESAVPASPDAGTRDWVESLVVCAVIVFAIRAFFLQPFKIPTGSMQPTLNGIIATRMPTGESGPNPVVKAWELVTRGRNYVRVEAPCDGQLVKVDSNVLRQLRLFVTLTRLHFVDNAGNPHTKLVWAPALQLIGLPEGQGAAIDSRTSGLWLDRDQVGTEIKVVDTKTGEVAIRRPIPVKAGQVLAAGSVDSGDMVLVDKLSYHFRQPKRGEVFVFNTRNIADIQNSLSPAEGSQHYIKRLTGLPGDSLAVKEDGGPLWVNGELAKEKYVRRVFEAKAADGEGGYRGYSTNGFRMQTPPWGPPGPPREGYFAMGDNSYNSYDSRYWGAVPEENLVGPGLFALWPFTTGHWGLIK
ncbi:MAG: signal peptidase I [Verrucomicrobiales bacterium]